MVQRQPIHCFDFIADHGSIFYRLKDWQIVISSFFLISIQRQDWHVQKTSLGPLSRHCPSDHPGTPNPTKYGRWVPLEVKPEVLLPIALFLVADLDEEQEGAEDVQPILFSVHHPSPLQLVFSQALIPQKRLLLPNCPPVSGCWEKVLREDRLGGVEGRGVTNMTRVSGDQKNLLTRSFA